MTELAYGVDLVREQLRIAAGQPMRVHGAAASGGVLQPRGHAIECRITAEDPLNDFLPASGTLQYLRVPSGPGVRWDGGVEAGQEVTLFYDPLLAKLIVWGETREVAIQRMRRALSELVIVGLPTSQAFHLRVMDDPDFQKGAVDITYLERAGARVLAAMPRPALERALAVAAALVADERRAAGQPDGRMATSPESLRPSGRPAVGPSPWVVESRRLGLRDGLE